MKRRIAFALALTLAYSLSAIAADSTDGSSSSSSTTSGSSSSSTAEKKTVTAEPYKASEFPSWALDLRRAEAVAFGSLPFMVFFSQTIVETYRCSQHDWDRAYAPWPVKSTGGATLSSEEFLQTFAAGCVGAVIFSLVDHFLVVAKRHKAKRIQAEKPAATYTVERTPLDDSATFGETPIPTEPPPQPSVEP